MYRKILTTLAAVTLVAVGTLIAPGLAGGTEIEPNGNPGCVGRLAELTNGTNGKTAVHPDHVTAVIGTGPSSYTVLLDDGRSVQGLGSSQFGISEVNNAMNCRTIGDSLGATRFGQ